MNQIHLGYDKDGIHCPALTAWESRFLGILWVDHVGRDNRIAADVLAATFFCALSGLEVDEADMEEVAADMAAKNPLMLARWKRDVRRIHNHLLLNHPNIPLLSAAGLYGGYWMAETESEAREFYNTFRKRGMTGLIKASRGKKAVLADIVQQLTFRFEELSPVVDEAPAGGMSAPIEVVDALLEKMTANPERFAGELRRLGEKFGSVLLPKDQLRAMQATAAELQRLVAGINF
jgi:hypothetical protein